MSDRIEVLPSVLGDLALRVSKGARQYGEPLTTRNGRDAMQDAYEEALDLALYLKQAMLERPAQALLAPAAPVAPLAAGLPVETSVTPPSSGARATHIVVTNPFRGKVTLGRVYAVVERNGSAVRIIDDDNQPLWCGGIAWEFCPAPSPDGDEAKEREAAKAAYAAGADGGTVEYTACKTSFVNGWLACARAARRAT